MFRVLKLSTQNNPVFQSLRLCAILRSPFGSSSQMRKTVLYSTFALRQMGLKLRFHLLCWGVKASILSKAKAVQHLCILKLMNCALFLLSEGHIWTQLYILDCYGHKGRKYTISESDRDIRRSSWV